MKRNKIGGTRRPLRTEAWQGRDDSRSRGYAASTTAKSAVQPSEEFDWDTAIFLHDLTVRDLDYPLSREQKARLRNA